MRKLRKVKITSVERLLKLLSNNTIKYRLQSVEAGQFHYITIKILHLACYRSSTIEDETFIEQALSERALLREVVYDKKSTLLNFC